ncbi:MAG: ParB/RepB/Spo0J family partition protein [Candidatus Liptonbacteria bacterium]
MLGRGLQSLIPPSDFPKENGNNPDGSPVSSPNSGEQNNQGLTVPTPQVLAPAPVVPEEHPVAPESPSANPEKPSVVPEKPIAAEPAPTHAPVTHSAAHKTQEYIFQIEVDKIKPNPAQPRRAFDPESIRELASSIREFGLLQPIVVTKFEREVPTGTEVEYVLISGERRLLASKLLGLERIPAIIRNVDLERERLELAVIENIQREDLNPIEIARSFARLQDEFRLTQREIAARLGKSREVVANAVRLLDLPPSIQEAIVKGEINESHGRLLLAIDDPGAQEKLFRDLLSQRFTTRELKHRVDMLKNKPQIAEQEKKAGTEITPELKVLQERLSSELGAPVAIQKNGETGKIVITFYSPEELQNIVQKLEDQK